MNRIVHKLTCVLEADGDHVRRMVSTNRLIPLGSFKSRSVACLFGGWAAKFRGKGRRMTKKLAMLVCKRLRLHFDLEPGTKEESERFLHLLQAARKKRLRKPRAKTAAMDTCETQPMDLQDIVLDPSVCLGAIVFRPQDPVLPPEVPEVHNIEDDYVDYAAQHDLRTCEPTLKSHSSQSNEQPNLQVDIIQNCLLINHFQTPRMLMNIGRSSRSTLAPWQDSSAGKSRTLELR